MVDKAVSSSTIYIICLLHLLRGQVYQSHLPLASLSRLPLVSLSYLPLSVLLAIGTCATSADWQTESVISDILEVHWHNCCLPPITVSILSKNRVSGHLSFFVWLASCSASSVLDFHDLSFTQHWWFMRSCPCFASSMDVILQLLLKFLLGPNWASAVFHIHSNSVLW